jgi:hypothetical protein
MSLDRYRLSGLRVRAVSHCTELGLVSVTHNKYACGEAIGWCLDSDLDDKARGNPKYVGLRIIHPKLGECWGHALTQHLPTIFED